MAITQATSLADFSTGIGTAGAVLQVDNADQRIGIGTTDPQGTLQVGIAITMDGTAGVITASSFSGSGGNLTFTGADISAATASFTGNVSVGGTLTYEDVTNIDAVGVITARTGVKVTAGGVDVTAGGLNVTAGIATFKNEVNADGGIDVAGGVNVGAALTVGGAVNVTGAVTLNANLDLQDNDYLRIGTGDDLQIYHNGTSSFLTNDTGSLFVGGSRVKLTNAAVTEVYVDCLENGRVDLMYDASVKLTTKSDGVDITGELQCDTLDVDGDADFGGGKISFSEGGNVLDFADNIAARFGAGNDLRIYHTGSHSFIKDAGTGNLYINSSKLVITDAGDTETMANFIENGAVELFHNGVKKLETSSAGVTVTGTLNATTAITENGNALATNGKAVAMALVFG